MLLSDRRTLIFGMAALAAGACGFQPVYREGSGALVGKVSLPEASDPISFAFRERMRRRLGAGGSDFILRSAIRLEEEGLAVTRASDITRVSLTGFADAELVEAATGEVIRREAARSATGYDATGEVFATRSARRAAEERLAIELAEITASMLLAWAESGLKE